MTGICAVRQSKPDQLPMIVKNFRKVEGKEAVDVAGIAAIRSGMPVWTFDLYFADSMRRYDTDYVQARDNRVAKRKIKRKYPHVVKFDFGVGYAD